MADKLVRVIIRPHAVHFGLCMPCTCHALKCVEPGNTLALFFLSACLFGVDTTGAFFSLGPRLLASSGQRNNGVAAESEFGLGALMFVDIEPGLAGWAYSQVQAVAIGQ